MGVLSHGIRYICSKKLVALHDGFRVLLRSDIDYVDYIF